MERFKKALNNNRSRVAAAATPVSVAVAYIVCDVLGLPEDIAKLASGAIGAALVAYIVGNGKYEANQLMVDGTPDPPVK